jgi:hypothetical protein
LALRAETAAFGGRPVGASTVFRTSKCKTTRSPKNAEPRVITSVLRAKESRTQKTLHDFVHIGSAFNSNTQSLIIAHQI